MASQERHISSKSIIFRTGAFIHYRNITVRSDAFMHFAQVADAGSDPLVTPRCGPA